MFSDKKISKSLFDPKLEEKIEAKEKLQIEVMLEKISSQNLKKLEIICETESNCLTSQSIELIKKMKSLTHLSLIWSRKLTSQMIM